MASVQDLATPCNPNFCPGCGDFGIWSAFKKAAVESGWDSSNTAMIAGVGCHGHILNFVKIASFGSLHGRAYPVGEGVKMANHDLNVFVFTGDGDSLAEGGNHFMHACRRNHDINIMLHDNAIYGLTTGQTSPRSPHGFVTKSTPEGNLDEPLNVVAVAIAAGATFVARAYAGDIPKVAQLMKQAVAHKGISILDILQPCVTFNKLYTHQFYQDNAYWLDEKYDPTNKAAAFAKALEWGEKAIAMGVFYKEEKPSYEQQIPALAAGAQASKPVEKRDIAELYRKYT